MKTQQISLPGTPALGRHCEPKGKWSGDARLTQNICVLSGVQMMGRSGEPRGRASRRDSPNDCMSLQLQPAFCQQKLGSDCSPFVQVPIPSTSVSSTIPT